MAVDRRSLARTLYGIAARPITHLRQARMLLGGLRKARRLEFSINGSAYTEQPNDLWNHFYSNQIGPGIWKWKHYFEVYERHFAKFRNKEVSICEIGVYSGGSLGMWRAYFGPKCRVYGVDIEEACKAYEGDGVEVFIGDQADRAFWKTFKEKVPSLDIIVDDGGHRSDQQIVTLEELLPHLRAGGVYLCEDIHGTMNEFSLYVSGLSLNMNASGMIENVENNERRLVSKTTAFQSTVHSIHLYPYVAVIERRNAPLSEFVAPKHGTQWQPFIR